MTSISFSKKTKPNSEINPINITSLDVVVVLCLRDKVYLIPPNWICNCWPTWKHQYCIVFSTIMNNIQIKSRPRANRHATASF